MPDSVSCLQSNTIKCIRCVARRGCDMVGLGEKILNYLDLLFRSVILYLDSSELMWPCLAVHQTRPMVTASGTARPRCQWASHMVQRRTEFKVSSCQSCSEWDNKRVQTWG